MQGKWKENVSWYNHKGVKRKKTKFKHRVKDKRNLIKNMSFTYYDLVFLYDKPIYDYIIDRLFTYNRKYCQKIANRTERSKNKEFLRKLKIDVELFDEKFEKDFDLKKSVDWCVS